LLLERNVLTLAHDPQQISAQNLVDLLDGSASCLACRSPSPAMTAIFIYGESKFCWFQALPGVI